MFEGGGIFLSYRRQESGHVAGRLYDRLADRFGSERVFIDVDAINPGVDFVQAISRAVETCAVLLAVIGPHWLDATDDRGRRRLDDPDDVVRVEIEAALTRDVRVIPILVDSAIMPDRQELPEGLKSLVRHNALIVRHETFRSDAERLVAAIKEIVPSREHAQSVQQPSGQFTQQKRWRLELLTDSGSRKTFSLLSTAGDAHEISVALAYSYDTIEVDGECVVKVRDIDGKEYDLSSLGSHLGTSVSIKAETGPWAYRMRWLTVKIGDQVLVSDAKHKK